MTRISIILLLLVLLISSCQQEDHQDERLTKSKSEKITICHYDSAYDTWKTIRVSINAVNAHLNHGDELGECFEEFDGLLAYYPFSGNADDQSGNEFHATVSGATLTEDRNGNSNRAFSFDGIDDYITAPIDMGTLFNVGDPIVFSLWLSSDFDTPVSFDFILGGVPGGGPVFFAAVREGDQGKLRVRLYAGAHGLSDGNVLDGNWHHVVWGLDANNTVFYYIDGQPQSNLPTVGAVTGETELVFGGRLDQSLPFTDFFTGKIDDIRIFNRGLTEAEILALFNE